VVRKREALDERSVLVADMTVAYKVFRETFASKVTLDRPKLEILVEYLDGPFRSLENRWRFKPQDERSSEVEFFVDYEFRSRALGLLMGSVFEATFRRFAEAFERRADRIYGNAKVARA
jgi:coenzyme Q-binding protein COQ10